MRFRSFLEFGGGLGAATSMIHGGLGNPVGDGSNTSMGIESKYFGPEGKIKKTKDACKFGNPKNCKNPEGEAADKFGFDTPQDKEGARERWASWIDKRRRLTPIRNTQVYT